MSVWRNWNLESGNMEREEIGIEYMTRSTAFGKGIGSWDLRIG